MWTPGSVQGLVSVLSDMAVKLKFIFKNISYIHPITWPEGAEWEYRHSSTLS